MAKRILTNMLSEKLYQTEDFDNSDWEIKKMSYKSLTFLNAIIILSQV